MRDISFYLVSEVVDQNFWFNFGGDDGHVHVISARTVAAISPLSPVNCLSARYALPPISGTAALRDVGRSLCSFLWGETRPSRRHQQQH